MKKKIHIILTGGGSAGHIIPLLSIKETIESKRKDITFSYIGQKKSLEEKFAKENTIPFHAIACGKLRRYFDWKNFLSPFQVCLGIIQSIGILIRTRPALIISKGGFVSLPVGLASFFLRIPLILHESDCIPGLANKILSRFAKKICLSFEDSKKYISSKKTVFTGLPLRKQLKPHTPEEKNTWQKKAYDFTKLSPTLPIILVLGGSLGAQKLVEKISEIWYHFDGKAQFIVQTGKGKLLDPSTLPSYVRQYEYLHTELRTIFCISDIIISRAGATSIFEYAYLKKACIFVPLGTHQSRGDQIINAKIFEKNKATLLYYENENSQKLVSYIQKLLRDPMYRRLLEINIGKLASPHASEKITNLVFEIIGQ